MTLRERSPVMYSNNIELLPGSSLPSSAQDDLKLYVDLFSSKEFTLSQAQGLPTYITQNAYQAEEGSFSDISTKIHRSKLPPEANGISSPVIYKIKILDDGSKLCKKTHCYAHGNHENDRHKLKTDSATC